MRRMVIMRATSATLAPGAHVITERAITSDTFNESSAAPCTASPWAMSLSEMKPLGRRFGSQGEGGRASRNRL